MKKPLKEVSTTSLHSGSTQASSESALPQGGLRDRQRTKNDSFEPESTMLPTTSQRYDADHDKYGERRWRSSSASFIPLDRVPGPSIAKGRWDRLKNRRVPCLCGVSMAMLVALLGAASGLMFAWTVFSAYFEIGFCNGSCLFIAPKRPAVASLPLDMPCTLSLPPSNGTSPPPGIPKLIHQTWKTTTLPSKFENWANAWKGLHPSWTYRLWTDDDNRNLVKEHYAWLLPTFDALPKNIMRVDFSRLLYMHQYGGIYSDLDLEPIRPLDPLMQNRSVILAFMSRDDNPHNIPNAWFASVSGHPFWLLAAATVVQRASAGGMVEAVTGPRMLTELVRQWAEVCSRPKAEWSASKGIEAGDVSVLRAGMIFPYDWTKPGSLWRTCSAESSSFDAQECKKHFPDAYTITYWSHSWGSQ